MGNRYSVFDWGASVEGANRTEYTYSRPLDHGLLDIDPKSELVSSECL